MKTLLLCGYRSSDNLEHPLGVECDNEGQTLIDRRILELRELGQTVVCVLSGATADQQLRCCRLIQDTELVFDVNEPGGTLISNTRAGVFAVPTEPCYALPLEIPIPPVSVWNFLRNEYAKIGFATPEAVLQATTSAQSAPWHFGFPLLITRTGNKVLQDTPSLKSLVDTRLKYLHLEFRHEAELEPAPKPL